MLRAFVVLLSVIVAACGARIPLTERLDADELFAHGMERLEARRWADAAEAFERFVFRFPGHARQQEARFRLAEAYLGRRELLTAANEFLRFATDYPTHNLAHEAMFGVCRSYAQLSPRVQLDQQYTEAAVEHCEALVAYYPESPHTTEARAIVEEMREKLALKQFQIGEHYRRRRAFDSAILSYSDVLDRYPATAAAPRSLLRLYEVYERLGYEQEQEQARQRLLRDYPGSAEAQELQQRTVAGPP